MAAGIKLCEISYRINNQSGKSSNSGFPNLNPEKLKKRLIKK